MSQTNFCQLCERPSLHRFCSSQCEIEFDQAMKEQSVLEALDVIQMYLRDTISVIPTDTRIRIAEKLTSLGHKDQSKHAN